MARVTVEDCLDKVENRFELVVVGAQRANEVAAGAAITVERDNDKNTVVALREIAKQTVTVDSLKENVVKNLQKPSELDEYELVESRVRQDDDEKDMSIEETVPEAPSAEPESEEAEAAAEEEAEAIDPAVEEQIKEELENMQEDAPQEVPAKEPEADMSFEEDNLDVND